MIVIRDERVNMNQLRVWICRITTLSRCVEIHWLIRVLTKRRARDKISIRNYKKNNMTYTINFFDEKQKNSSMRVSIGNKISYQNTALNLENSKTVSHRMQLRQESIQKITSLGQLRTHLQPMIEVMIRTTQSVSLLIMGDGSTGFSFAEKMKTVVYITSSQKMKSRMANDQAVTYWTLHLNANTRWIWLHPMAQSKRSIFQWWISLKSYSQW